MTDWFPQTSCPMCLGKPHPGLTCFEADNPQLKPAGVKTAAAEDPGAQKQVATPVASDAAVFNRSTNQEEYPMESYQQEALTKPDDFDLPYRGESKKQTYPIEVELNAKEIEACRLQLGKVSTAREKLATEHAEAQAKWKEAHKKLEEQFDGLCKALGTGKEARDVKCEWEVDVKKKVAHLKRLDTNEYVFKNRKLQSWDLEELAQEELPMDDEAPKNGKADEAMAG